MLKAKLRGKKRILNKLKTRINRMANDIEKDYVKPLEPVVKEIQATLANGTVGPKSFNHIYTQNLYNNTRAQLTALSFSSKGFEAKLQFGYFVEYGLNLERGGVDKDVSLSRILDWAARKGLPISAGYGVYNKIKDKKRGADAHPIINLIWAKNTEKYKTKVFSNIRRKWR